MDHDPNDEKLGALATKIQQAQTPSTPGLEPPLKGNRIGYDFIGAVLGCTFLGWLMDQMLGTKPWGIIAFLIIGFVLGVYRAWQTLSKQEND